MMTQKEPGYAGFEKIVTSTAMCQSDPRKEPVSPLSAGSAASDQVAAGYTPYPAWIQVSPKHTFLISYS